MMVIAAMVRIMLESLSVAIATSWELRARLAPVLENCSEDSARRMFMAESLCAIML
jgi:hypothetical protein